MHRRNWGDHWKRQSNNTRRTIAVSESRSWLHHADTERAHRELLFLKLAGNREFLSLRSSSVPFNSHHTSTTLFFKLPTWLNTHDTADKRSVADAQSAGTKQKVIYLARNQPTTKKPGTRVLFKSYGAYQTWQLKSRWLHWSADKSWNIFVMEFNHYDLPDSWQINRVPETGNFSEVNSIGLSKNPCQCSLHSALANIKSYMPHVMTKAPSRHKHYLKPYKCTCRIGRSHPVVLTIGYSI